MMIELLRAAAATDPAVEAVVAPERSITYAALVELAEATGRGLRAAGIQRVGSVVRDPVQVVALQAAGSAVGTEVCVYPRDLDAAAVAATAERLQHDVVVVDAPLDVPGVRTVSFEDLATDDGELGAPSSTDVLILTTGTSGVPKGVRHDWRRLIAGVRRTDGGPGQRWLLAYNPNQFAAYQVMLHVFVHGATLVVPRTSHARDAVEAMHEHRVTHVSATPTFWRLLVGTRDPRTADLALQQITLGGEASPESLLRTLASTFPEARISHVYAGTEFGSAVAVTDGRAGLPIGVLDRGEDQAVHFRVVDGELQVRSRNAMLGYQGAEEPAAEWHPTGDLVEERDGRLQFVGRTVEIINVGGAKVHPLPIEELVSGVDGVLVAAVYGSPNAITGQIVSVDVVAAPGFEEEDVKTGIHAACRVLPPPGRPRRIRFVEELQVRGQKIVRTNPEVRG